MGQSLGSVTFSDGLVFDIDQAFRYGDYDKAAVAMSGGLDSTFVAWALTQLIGPANVYGASIILDRPTTVRRQWEPVKAAELATQLGVTHMTHSSNYMLIDDSRKSDFQRFIDHVRTTYQLQAFFLGEARRAYAQQLVLTPAQQQMHLDTKIVSPLKTLKKQHVVQLYDMFGITNLITNTWSCTIDGLTHCGQCYCCRERHNGFVRANKPDPTTYKLSTETINELITQQWLIVNPDNL